ncbi:MAG: diversity-generating retroelement protein Avd [Clostridia bacterium]|nr:diversity-generating retroelement protein Avd [Clostridia bacterium]
MAETEEDFKILQKIFDMMDYAYPAIAQFPKSEKFGLALDIKRTMDKMLALSIEARKKYYKKTTLQELDIAIAVLKAYIRLSFNLGFLPVKKYGIWSDKVVEIGKMLGGWMKTATQKPAST